MSYQHQFFLQHGHALDRFRFLHLRVLRHQNSGLFELLLASPDELLFVLSVLERNDDGRRVADSRAVCVPKDVQQGNVADHAHLECDEKRVLDLTSVLRRGV